MKITPQCVVALTWTLKDTLGEELDVLDSAIELLVGGNDLLPTIESALQGYCAGAVVELQLEPQQAFGDFNDQLLFLEQRALFPQALEVGLLIEGSALPAACHSAAPTDLLYTVTDLYPDHVVLDGNHPLAGIALRIRLKVHAVREATPEELEANSCGTGFFQWRVESSSE
ncbi:MAG: hypothetical protein RIR79_724 [Pseudomonadota bacterium]|jgi:FKBP-type peptidyl-prolyl cis-trans isomerase SlyD